MILVIIGAFFVGVGWALVNSHYEFVRPGSFEQVLIGGALGGLFGLLCKLLGA